MFILNVIGCSTLALKQSLDKITLCFVSDLSVYTGSEAFIMEFVQYTASCLFKDVIAVGKVFSIHPSIYIVHKNIPNLLHRGSYMSAHVLMKELKKRDKM